MDSATLLGVVGIGGTVVGALTGTYGALGAARISGKGQARLDEQKARRQAYAACSAALIARRDAARVLMESLREDAFEESRVTKVSLQDLLDQRAHVIGTVGAVAIEGPDAVVALAEAAALGLEEWSERLRIWIDSGDEGMINDQFRFGRDDQLEVTDSIERFTRACRKALYPEVDRERRRTRLRLGRR